MIETLCSASRRSLAAILFSILTPSQVLSAIALLGKLIASPFAGFARLWVVAVSDEDHHICKVFSHHAPHVEVVQTFSGCAIGDARTLTSAHMLLLFSSVLTSCCVRIVLSFGVAEHNLNAIRLPCHISIDNKGVINGGGGGSRTRVRNYLQQRAFMLFHVHFCLVIIARNGRRNDDDQPDRSRHCRPGGTALTSLLCDDRYRPVGEA